MSVSNLSDVPKVAPHLFQNIAPSRLNWKRIRSGLQFIIAFAGTVAFLCYLLFAPGTDLSHDAPPSSQPDEEPAQVVGYGLIQVRADSQFGKKLAVVTAQKETISKPLISVSGRVAASLRPGQGKGSDYWQFDLPNVLTTYTDWKKAQADLAFAEKQLVSIKQLAEARLDAQRKVVARLEKLVAAGTDTPKDLAAEKAKLIQTEIQGRKDIHESTTSVRMAKRAEATAAKQLQQAGLDPDLLRSATSEMDIVLADVPEGWLNQVKIGQECWASFFGFPGKTFTGKVVSTSPVLSKQRRTLRVLIIMSDPEDKLRPGMFAEIGLGTDPRDTLLVPADSVLHIKRADYVLAAVDSDLWAVVKVQVGSPHNGKIEILSGLRPGERIIGKGAILFKPLVVHALRDSSPSTREDRP